MKNCSKCGLPKDLSVFNKDKKNKSGYRSECNTCRKEYGVNYYKNNLGEIKEKNRKRYSPEKKKQQRITYKKNNPEKVKESNKKYRNSNSEKIKEWVKTNSEVLSAKRRVYKKNKYNNDSFYKLKHNIGCLIRFGFKKHGFTKKSRTYEILGCSYEEFKLYLESRWEHWMNWGNHGLYNGTLDYGWDIDHIIPLSSAKTERELILLNHYTNLQPLCGKVNRDIKRNNII